MPKTLKELKIMEEPYNPARWIIESQTSNKRNNFENQLWYSQEEIDLFHTEKPCEVVTVKEILDVCCGPRMFYFNKRHPNVLYQDIRQEVKGYIPLRPSCEVQPDVLMDFRSMSHPDKSFKMVVFDPPHLLHGGKTGWQRQKYGILNKQTWKEDLSKGFSECWRVLDDYGTIVFKWNEESIAIKEVLKLFPVQPILGHPTARSGKTKWCIFFKNKQEVTAECKEDSHDDGIPPKDKSLGILPTIL